jgi:uncharacterized membrane protein (UPF0127 family)
MPNYRQFEKLPLFESFCKKNEVDRVKISGKIGDVDLKLTCLTTPESQMEGFSKYSPTENHGLLFIYTEEQPLNFWMKGVDFPLDIMYFDADRNLIEFHNMQPEEEPKTIYTSKQPAMFAVEVPEGWCEANSIKVGSKLNF